MDGQHSRGSRSQAGRKCPSHPDRVDTGAHGRPEGTGLASFLLPREPCPALRLHSGTSGSLQAPPANCRWWQGSPHPAPGAAISRSVGSRAELDRLEDPGGLPTPGPGPGFTGAELLGKWHFWNVWLWARHGHKLPCTRGVRGALSLRATNKIGKALRGLSLCIVLYTPSQGLEEVAEAPPQSQACSAGPSW